jgi:hypothetical protein
MRDYFPDIKLRLPDLSSAAGLSASSVPRQNPSVSPPSGLIIAVKTRASMLSLTN